MDIGLFLYNIVVKFGDLKAHIWSCKKRKIVYIVTLILQACLCTTEVSAKTGVT